MSVQPAIGDWVGQVLEERFVIHRLLACGGMGAVFVADDLRLGQPAAVKVLAVNAPESQLEVLRLRFEAEARILARLRDPRILRPLSWGRTERGDLYIVSELLEGVPLDVELIQRGAMAPQRTARLLIDLCAALGEAHAAGVVHRDIKPGNVFLQRSRSGDEVARLLDFGVAKLLDAGSLAAATQEGMVVGTPSFMAPEQGRGDPVDGRADLYALGVVAYACLTGRVPFEGTAAEVMVAHAVAPPPAFADRAPGVRIDPKLEQLVRWALEKRPDDRPPTAAALRAALEQWAAAALVRATAAVTEPGSLEPTPGVEPEGEDLAAPPTAADPPGTRQERLAVPNRRAVWTIAGAAVALLGAAWGGYGLVLDAVQGRLASRPSELAPAALASPAPTAARPQSGLDSARELLPAAPGRDSEGTSRQSGTSVPLGVEPPPAPPRSKPRSKRERTKEARPSVSVVQRFRLGPSNDAGVLAFELALGHCARPLEPAELTVTALSDGRTRAVAPGQDGLTSCVAMETGGVQLNPDGPVGTVKLKLRWSIP